MVRAESLFLAIDFSRGPHQRRAAQEALEAVGRDFAWLFLVDMLLVIVEEIILLGREICRLEGHLKPVCWLWRSFYVIIVASVDLLDEVESVL